MRVPKQERQDTGDLTVEHEVDPAPPEAGPAAGLAPGAAPGAAPGRERTAGGAMEGLRPLVTLLGNVTVLTSLLYFFGWRQTATQDADLGLDQDIFGLGSQDYVLRSVQPVVRLLAVLGVLGLLFVYLDHLLRWALARDGDRGAVARIAVRVLDVAWLAVPLAAYLLLRANSDSADLYIAYPLALGAGVLLIVYRAQVRRRLGLRIDPTEGRSTLERGAVAMLLAVAVFWATSNYADVEGHRLADGFRADVLHQVTVFSGQRLDLSGAQESTVGNGGDLYHYRYTGLRLMAHSGGHYFLVPATWTPQDGTLVVLADSDPVRLEFVS